MNGDSDMRCWTIDKLKMDMDGDDEMQVYLPDQELAEDEELVVDNSAYDMLHSMGVEWPCLSFDILSDNLGMDRLSVRPGRLYAW